MVSSSRPGWILDPNDPRAPSAEAWERMTDRERARVVATLPSEFEPTEASPPEGDIHSDVVYGARDALRTYFRKLRRQIYIAANIAVYYPGERMFSPDVIAVLEAEDRPRDSWIVSAEGNGLSLCIEVSWLGRRAKDFVGNVERYARLGIGEYFLCDLRRLELKGYRLGGEPGIYTPLLPKARRMHSEVLDLDLAIDGQRLRFFHGSAAIPYADELIARLDAAVEEAGKHAQAEAERAQAEAERAQDAERRLADALAELEALKRR
jgi:hypothetical protein